MTGCYVFTNVCSFTFAGGGGGGASSSWWGGEGYPIPGMDGGGGDTPSQVWTGGGGWYTHAADWGRVPPHWDWMRYPPPMQDWMGYLCLPPPPVRRQISIASPCYAVGMPLAFTQEDFLVYKLITQHFSVSSLWWWCEKSKKGSETHSVRIYQ